MFTFRTVWNHLLKHRDGEANSSGLFILFSTASVSSEAHESDVFVVRRTRCSVPPPSRMRRLSTVLNQDGARVFICFYTARHLELRVLVFHKTLLEGWVPYFVLPDSVGLILSCNKLASDRHAPIEVPAKGTTTKRPPQTQQLSCSLR